MTTAPSRVDHSRVDTSTEGATSTIRRPSTSTSPNRQVAEVFVHRDNVATPDYDAALTHFTLLLQDGSHLRAWHKRRIGPV
jgi:hypothetical protein